MTKQPIKVISRRDRWFTVSRDLESFKELKPNWDSYGAQPTNPTAIEHALLLAQAMETAGYVEIPVVVPTVDGGVQFEFENGEIIITVEA